MARRIQGDRMTGSPTKAGIIPAVGSPAFHLWFEVLQTMNSRMRRTTNAIGLDDGALNHMAQRLCIKNVGLLER